MEKWVNIKMHVIEMKRKVRGNNRVVIPKPICDALRLKEGVMLKIIVTDKGKIILEKDENSS